MLFQVMHIYDELHRDEDSCLYVGEERESLGVIEFPDVETAKKWAKENSQVFEYEYEGMKMFRGLLKVYELKRFDINMWKEKFK